MDVLQTNHNYLRFAFEKAKEHYENGEYGKCCSYYLLVFHYDDSYCNLFKEEFLHAFAKWLKKLIVLEKFEEVHSFVKTTLEIFSPKLDILLAASQEFFVNGLVFDSLKILLCCQVDDVTNLTLVENIEQLRNMLVDRWHFRMLNDKKRNMAYCSALTKAYQKGHRKVLDIGSGTGIFSLMASKLGFECVSSCDASEVMCDIQKKCIINNGANNNIHLINKLSTELEIGRDIPEKPTLVVTEIFDCALLGEGVLSTLINAWEHLLDSNNGEVIPHSAVVYGICIECEELRRHNRYHTCTKYNTNSTFYGRKDSCDEKDHPYTTEYMAGIKGGYRALSDHFIVDSFDFNQNKQLKEMISRESKTINVPVISGGILDAIMVYFVLHVNATMEVNTLDKEGLCWEQAVYSVLDYKDVQASETILLDVSCAGEYLDIKLINGKDTLDQNVDNQVQNNPSDLNSEKAIGLCNSIYSIDRCLVSRLNDSLYNEKYRSDILHQMELLKGKGINEISACLLCCGLSLLPLVACEVDSVQVYLIDPTNNQVKFLEHWITLGRIKCVSRPLLNEVMKLEVTFDIIISEPVNCSGLIKENFIEDISIIKQHFTSCDTLFLPSTVNLYGCFVSSDRLAQEHRVMNDNIPLRLDISNYINEYQVSTYPDIDGISLINEPLSNKCQLLSLDLQCKFEKGGVESFETSEGNMDIKIIRCGVLTGVIFWFEIILCGGDSISTKPSSDTHWHQACAIFFEQKFVCESDKISLKVFQNKSNFHFQVS